MSNQPSLTIKDQQVLAVASSQAITNSFSSLKSCFNQSCLLPNSNSYYREPGKKLRDDWGQLPDQFQDQELLEYLSASVLVHAYEGWGYLSQAMQGLIRGDLGAVRHLSYYAELRAALSILASQGVGIYGGKNVVVDDKGFFHKYSKLPTHKIAWLSLEEWSKTSSSGALFGEEIVAFGVPLREWLHEFEGTQTPNYTGASLIKTWGLDLDKYSSDKDSRNEVSYQVNLSHTEQTLSPDGFVSFIKDIWDASNPSIHAFSYLDNHLLNSILSTTFDHKEVIFRGISYAEAVDSLCEGLGVESYITEFLKRERKEPIGLSILSYAKSGKDTFEDHQFLDMFSRAFLLLRLSSACLSKMMKDSSTSMDDFNFWWSSMSYSSGLAALGSLTGNYEIDVEEFWEEIEVSIDEMEAKHDPASQCWKTFMRISGVDIEALSRLEKIALFGMART